MCGIAGPINCNLSREKLEQRLLAMQTDLYHRGPDDQGIFMSREGDAGLVSCRLAILDLSPAGHQPMSSKDGRYTIAFNGEIYNFLQLREEMEGQSKKRKAKSGTGEVPALRSHSDTEVVLELFRREGPKCLARLDGMFAFAIWDEEEKSCFLARDPLGIKPLYYSLRDDSLCFASELRTLVAGGLTNTKLSAQGVLGYLTHGSVPEPLTLLEKVSMLAAGHYLSWRDGKATLTKYWDVAFGDERTADRGHRLESRKAEKLKADNLKADNLKSKAAAMTYPDAVRITRRALEESIARHLVSDVPVGVFLSGGLDSTALVALASQQTKEPLRTFSISFDDPAYNEGEVAARTASHFGTKHHDWRLDSQTARDLLKEFLARSDQPSVDGFNTFCVSKVAHDHGLKVVLSGLGGDEVFGGYPSFQRVPELVRARQRTELVRPARTLAGRLLELAPSPRYRRLGSYLRNSGGSTCAYECVRGVFTEREARQLLPMFDLTPGNGTHSYPVEIPAQPTLEDEVSYLELTRYMRNQLLRDSDVMSMAWSIELRVPFADRKLIDTVSSIPARWRLASRKRILLDAVPEFPDWVRRRPKQGFTFPFEKWVTAEWSDVFADLKERSPVPLQNWYRKWTVFALQAALEKLKVESGNSETLKD